VALKDWSFRVVSEADGFREVVAVDVLV